MRAGNLIPKRVLSVADYGPLLRTRQLLLEQGGYSVSSALGLSEAVAACRANSYDLLILGHTIADNTKDGLVRMFREHSVAPVLCLRRHLERGAKTAEYHVTSENPEDLLRAVASIFVLNPLLRDTLENAIGLTAADFGNVQLLGPGTTSLTIVTQRGFCPAFVQFFSQVKTEGSACGEAMRVGRRVISEDVAADVIYTEAARNVMLASKARACQSTPILTSSGRLVGVLSTHYQTSQRPSETKLARLDKLLESIADRVSLQVAALHPWPNPYRARA